MANVILERSLKSVDKNDLRSGYAAPQVDVVGGPIIGSTYNNLMSVAGAARASTFMFLILLATGAWAWNLESESTRHSALLIGLIAGLVFGVITAFAPKFARVTAPLYAAAQGVMLG